jgi:hypothetical protein
MASGIIQVTRQIGIAIGIAALGAIFHARVEHALATAAPHGLADGIDAIAWVGAAVCALSAVAVVVIAAAARRVPQAQPATR